MTAAQRSADRTLAAHYCRRHHFGVFARQCFVTLEPSRRFLPNWHVDHLCYMLTEAVEGRIQRLNINIPPRFLKSVLVSVALPAWLLGRDPSLRIMCVSYSRQLAETFAAQTRLVMEQDWYRQTFPDCQLSSRALGNMRTTRNGSRYAVGIGGAITGLGADIIIIDDPIKAQDALSEAARQRVTDFFDATVWTRLNNRRGGLIILTMQRMHEDDLAGHLIRGGGWTTVALPAIATEDTTHRLSPSHVYHRRQGELLHEAREGQAELDEMRRALGQYGFAAQYQQDPVPAIGHVVQRDWLRYFDHEPELFDRIVMSWDTASSADERSDYSAGTVWGRLGEDFYLLEVIRVQQQVPDLQRLIISVSRDYPDAVLLIEADGVGRGIAQSLWDRKLVPRRPLPIRPTADKSARFYRHLPLIEEGRLLLPQQADWLGDYVSELLAFPVGRHDDQVDSTSQALDYLTRDAARTRPLVRRDLRRRDIVPRTIVDR